MKRSYAILGLLIVGVFKFCMAEIIYVKNPQESPDAWPNKNPIYDSIQMAIESAQAGDEIWVARGTYLENVVSKNDLKLFGGFIGFENSIHDRILWNLKPVSIIDGAGERRCMLANFNTTIDGFTLKNGANVDRGAGIYINNMTNIEIKNVFIESCSVSWKGAGIFIETDTTGTIAIERVVVWNCDSYCGALEADERSKSTIISKNCTVVDNRSYGLELPIHFEQDERGNLVPIQPEVWDHSFINMICWKNANPYNINAPNPESDTHDAWSWARDFIDYSYVGKNAWEDLTHEDKWQGPKSNTIFEKAPDWNGSPQFVDPENGDFRLLGNSPCLHSGKDGEDQGAYPSNDVSGLVFYYSTQASVANVIVELKNDLGESNYISTNENGNWLFTNVINGPAIVTASKKNDQNDAITGSDALLILQYLAFLANLTTDQEFAADVTMDGNVSGSDAQAILRYLAFYSDNTGSTGNWIFSPDTSAIILQKDTTANFKAFVLGDVNNSWSANSIINLNAGNKTLPLKVKLNKIFIGIEKIVKIQIRIEDLSQSIHTALLTLEYDPEVFLYQATEKSDSCHSFMLAANDEENGKVHIAIAGVKGISCDNDIVQMHFKIKNNPAKPENSQMSISRAIFNDFFVDQVENGKVYFKNPVEPIEFEHPFSINCFPNPFNQATIISFYLPEETHVAASIFNIHGQSIKLLIDEKLSAGQHQLRWNATSAIGASLPAGVYFCRMELNNKSTQHAKQTRFSKKLFLLK